jgi:hypothetical protein
MNKATGGNQTLVILLQRKPVITLADSFLFLGFTNWKRRAQVFLNLYAAHNFVVPRRQ